MIKYLHMVRRAKKSPAEILFSEFIEICSTVPWWLSAVIAIILFTTIPFSLFEGQTLNSEKISVLILGTIFTLVCKYLIPLALLIGSLRNLFSRHKIQFIASDKSSYTDLKKKGVTTYEALAMQREDRKLHGHRCYIDNLTSYERTVVHLLAKELDPSEYYIFNNITIPSSVTGTTQIDHIIVSRFGIFVIENKDYNGWIFGNKNNKEWTQVLKGGKKYHFQNPLLQNFAHVSSLKEHMPFLKKCFYNVVVFSTASVFKTNIPKYVLHGDGLISYIQTKTKSVLSEGELLMAIGKLSVLCQTAQVSKEEHVTNLVRAHSDVDG